MSLKSLLLAVSSLVLFAGCEKKAATAPAAASAQPLDVGIITVAARPVTLTRELPGRTSAFRIAEVRARVSGIVLKRLFTEGADVQEGQVLYQIDPAPYQAALDSAKATLARAEANSVSTRLQAERSDKLVAARAVSQQEHDSALAASQGGQAEVAAAKAAVQTAEINLSYTKVTSPLAGRIGRSEVTEGAYVQQGAATLLAIVQQLDPLYVDLTQSSTEVLQLRRALAAGQLTRVSTGEAKVQLLLDNGTEYADSGSLQFSDVSVNASTNSITLRALFPNPRGELLPGLFVRARLEEGSQAAAILVPQLAVSRNAKGEATAFVIGADNKAELRVLKIARALGNQWLISDGLAVGDRIIVENLQRLRAGAPVNPSPTTLAAAQPGPAAPAAR